jgi:uncharacterized protein
MIADDLARLREFASHMRHAPESIARSENDDQRTRRTNVYRELFWNNARSLLASNFPVIRRLHSDSEWLALTAAFYTQPNLAEPNFTKFAQMFIAFLQENPTHWQTQRPFLADLAMYEWLETELRFSEAVLPIGAPSPSLHPNNSLKLSPLARVIGSAYPLQKIRPDFQPTEQTPTFLLLHRDAQNKVQFMELAPLSYALLSAFDTAERVSVETTLNDLAVQLGIADPASFVVNATVDLQRWLDLGVVIH